MMRIQVYHKFFFQKKTNFIYYIFLESDENPSKVEVTTPKIARIRNRCATIIWNEWSNERHWGPRVGVIAISTMEESAEKVRFFHQTFRIQRNLIYFLGFNWLLY
jgi:hypothetical protein